MARPRYPSDDVEKMLLRLPDGMRQRLADRARANFRSTNSEVIVMLARALGDMTQAATGDELAGDTPAAVPNTTALPGGASPTA